MTRVKLPDSPQATGKLSRQTSVMINLKPYLLTIQRMSFVQSDYPVMLAFTHRFDSNNTLMQSLSS